MPITTGAQDVPVQITGSSTFGRYPTVSPSRTYNMFITTADEGQEQWLVNFAGYSAIRTIVGGDTVGRGIFHSVRGNFLLIVIGTAVRRIDTVSGVQTTVGSLNTQVGEVVMDENLASQICIVDGSANAYIYNYADPSFGVAVLSDSPSSTAFIPNYVTYQNEFFIFGNGVKTADGSNWYVYTAGVGGGQDLTAQAQLALQTKPDYAIAAIRIPSAGNNLLVLGTTVAEVWTQIPQSVTYIRQQTLNIDYGCVSISTIAASDKMVAWLGINENSAPAIMVAQGGQATAISTDGIDYLLQSIQFPEQSTALMFRQDGHVFYQLTFYNPADNLTIAYDFTTQKFFDLTDWNFNYHPARQIAYFQGHLYFVSLNDGKLYLLSTDETQDSTVPLLQEYDIPRVRVCPTFRLPRPEKFRINLFTFVVESGTTPNVSGISQCEGYIITEDTNSIIYTEDNLPLLIESGSCQVAAPRIDVTISKDGGITYSNAVPYYMHNTGQYQCQPRFSRLGVANQFGVQMRFWNMGRVVVHNGVIEVAQ